MGEKGSRYLTLAEVKELLQEKAEERELSYEQSLSLSHAEKFVKLPSEETKELVSELLEKFDFMGEPLAYKLGDILPLDDAGIKAVFSKDRYTPSKEDCDEIIKTIKKYL